MWQQGDSECLWFRNTKDRWTYDLSVNSMGRQSITIGIGSLSNYAFDDDDNFKKQ